MTGDGAAANAEPDDADDLTLRQAADLLGVHYMTAYRYVRTGRLAAAQVGSTWRVPRASIERLGQPAPAGRARRGKKANRTDYVRRLRDHLIQGDEAESWRLTEQALASAFSPEALYLDVLGPALRLVGDEWAAGRVTTAEEHRASAVMYRLTGRLGPLLVRRGRSRGTIVLGAPADDFHGLATALVSDVLRGRGFSVADLGANTPPESFVEAVAGANRLVAVGIVVSAPIADAPVADTIAAIRSATDVPLLLGGVTIRDERHALGLGADAWTGSAPAAVDWFDEVARR